MKTVLVLDDDPAFLMIISYALKPLSDQIVLHTCTTIHDGLLSVAPDVIVSDVHFPLMVADEVLQTLRALFPKTRMVIMSGVTPPQLSAWTVNYDVAFLSKDDLLTEFAPFLQRLLADMG